jgi:hypothetical protein
MLVVEVEELLTVEPVVQVGLEEVGQVLTPQVLLAQQVFLILEVEEGQVVKHLVLAVPQAAQADQVS